MRAGGSGLRNWNRATVLSGTASFVTADLTTHGNWQGVYGSQGYDLANGPASLPSSAQVSLTGQSSYTWATSTTDLRDLQDGSSRLAATWYSSSSFNVNVNLTDGQTHALALYLLDWDNIGRSEQVNILDAQTGTKLASQTASALAGGEYLVFNVSGDVTLQITDVTGVNAVLSGLFLGSQSGTTQTPPTGTASFVTADTTTQGNWQGVYGSQGYDLANGPASLPSYAQVGLAGQSNYTWATSTTDVRDLQDGSSRLAATWYSSSSFNVNVNLTDGQTHALALYLLDWDNIGRSEQVNILDAQTGTKLASQTASAFSGGEYLVFNVSGDVTLQITDVTGANAVLSGLFLGSQSGTTQTPPTGTASFVTADTTTQGNWQGVYGTDGSNLANGPASLPSYAQVGLAGQSNYTWATSTTDVRDLQDGSSRLAATWYSSSSFNVNVNLTDGQTHQLALYLLDWDNIGRSEQVNVLDAQTGTVLASQTASAFSGGEYLVFNVSGDVNVQITDVTGANAVLSGLFFDPPGLGTTKVHALVASAGPNVSGNEGSAVTFSGTASGGSGALSESWNFGDGSTATGSLTPSHTYALYGTYTATLTVSDTHGDTKTSSTTVTVNDVAPTVNVGGPYSAVQGSAIAFAGSASSVSTQETAAGYSYLWTFGDGSTSTQQNPSHTYASAGSYSVTLKVTDEDSVSTTVSTTATVTVPALVVSAGPNESGNEGSAIAFSGTASGGSGALSDSWNFGDGSTATGSLTPSHTYSLYGTYTATLTVTDALGDTKSSSTTVTVNDVAPTVAIQDPHDSGWHTDCLHGRGHQPQPPGNGGRLQLSLELRRCRHQHPAGPQPYLYQHRHLHRDRESHG